MNLKNKVAIVTGASSGIGAEFSKALVERGCTVYGLARTKEKLISIHKSLGERFVAVPMDVTKRNDVEAWVKKTFSDSHLPDILVNNAGVGYFAEVDKLKVSEWEQMMNVNLNAVFYITRLIAPLMKENDDVCHIVNIASIAGLMGNPKLAGYNASKYALRGFSDALFKELRYDGIKVSCFFPGSIATKFFDSIDEMDTHSNMMQPKDVANTLIHVLETPDNFLINEIVMRPLNPKASD